MFSIGIEYVLIPSEPPRHYLIKKAIEIFVTREKFVSVFFQEMWCTIPLQRFVFIRIINNDLERNDLDGFVIHFRNAGECGIYMLFTLFTLFLITGKNIIFQLLL